MKFKRLNYLTPIRVYRGHYLDITLEYAKEFDGWTGLSFADVSELLALGYMDVQITETTTTASVRIRGRINSAEERPINLQYNVLVVSGFYDDGIANDSIRFQVLEPVFWTGNPIRINLNSRPTVPVPVFVEDEFARGNFKKVASIKVADIQDDNGYFVELDQILDSYLQRGIEQDFADFFALENDELGAYRKSIRRFHLGGYEANAEEINVPNVFTAVLGKRDPEKAFREANFWGLPTPFLTWRPSGFRQKIAGGYTQKMPASFMLENNLALQKNNSEGSPETLTVYANQYQQAVVIRSTVKYTFLLTQAPDGCRVMAVESNGAAFRCVAFFAGIDALDLLVKEIEDEEPLLMLIYQNSDKGTWVVVGFRAPMKADFSVLFTHEVLPEHNFNYKLEAAGNNGATGCVLLFSNDVDGKKTAVPVPESTGTTNSSYGFGLPTGSRVKAIIGLGANTYLFASQGGTLYKTTNNFSTITSVMSAPPYNTEWQIELVSPTEMLVMSYNGSRYKIFQINPVSGATISSYDPGTNLLHDGVRRFVWKDDTIFVQYGAGAADLLSKESTIALIESVEAFTGNYLPFLISTPEANTFTAAAVLNEENRWQVLIRENETVLPPEFGYVQQSLEVIADPQSFSWGIDGVATVTYANDGSYVRQARQLYFRNQAGAYEFLLLPGDGGITHTSKKVMSSRYVDAASALADGEEMIAWVNDSSRTLSTNTGFISKKEYDYFLQELLLTKEAYLVENGDWCPVKLNLAKAEPVMDRPNLYQIDLNLEKSWSR